MKHVGKHKNRTYNPKTNLSIEKALEITDMIELAKIQKKKKIKTHR